MREQDRFLPIANISRIMKKALPNNAKIAKDAKETVQECVSEFISFITSECVMSPKPLQAAYACPAQPLTPANFTLLQGQRQMHAGEAENDQRGGFAVGHDDTGLRGLC